MRGRGRVRVRLPDRRWQDQKTRRRAQLEAAEDEHVEDDDEADRYRRSSRQGHGRGRLKVHDMRQKLLQQTKRGR